MKPWQTWAVGVGASVLSAVLMWGFAQIFAVHVRLTALEVTDVHQHDQIEKLVELVLGLLEGRNVQ